MKFIHAADFHIDSPLRGLERYDGAPAEELRGATRKALDNLVQLAVDEAVDFILIAGDVYDGDWRDYNTGLFFRSRMARLREADIPVILLRGNHDAVSHITRELKLPDNVREFPSDKARTFAIEKANAAVHGRSFSSRTETADLTVLYPHPIKGAFNIGLLHTSADGREGHETYAPCTVAGLASLGYDYWALGHVHTREVLGTNPWILFPGNLQGRHIREQGSRGCTLVTVENDHVLSADHYPLDVVRWSICLVDATGSPDMDDLLDRVRLALLDQSRESEGRLLAARILLRGPCRAHETLSGMYERFVGECRALANDMAGGRVWVEKVKIETRSPMSAAELAGRSDTLGDLFRFIRETADDEARLQELLLEFKDLRQKLPIEIREGSDGLDFNDPALIRGLLDDAGEILLPRLLGQEKVR